jgi:hypothetical protein
VRYALKGWRGHPVAGMRVLDVASGTGDLALNFARESVDGAKSECRASRSQKKAFAREMAGGAKSECGASRSQKFQNLNFAREMAGGAKNSNPAQDLAGGRGGC